MTTTFEKIESCQLAALGGTATAQRELLSRLQDENWRVRYAAAVAIGDLGAAAKDLVPSLLEILAQEDAAPLYTQQGERSGGPAGANTHMPQGPAEDENLLDAWRRRGRIKQAVLWSLANIGLSNEQVLSFVHRYAVDPKEDYSVRAAANRALGVLGNKNSLKVLETASKDDEWCTNCEAKKSLKLLQHSL